MAATTCCKQQQRRRRRTLKQAYEFDLERLYSPIGSDVNKDWTCKDNDKDKDLTHKDQARTMTSLTVTKAVATTKIKLK